MLQAAQGIPAPPQSQAWEPSQGRRGWFSQTQPVSAQKMHFIAWPLQGIWGRVRPAHEGQPGRAGVSCGTVPNTVGNTGLFEAYALAFLEAKRPQISRSFGYGCSAGTGPQASDSRRAMQSRSWARGRRHADELQGAPRLTIEPVSLLQRQISRGMSGFSIALGGFVNLLGLVDLACVVSSIAAGHGKLDDARGHGRAIKPQPASPGKWHSRWRPEPAPCTAGGGCGEIVGAPAGIIDRSSCGTRELPITLRPSHFLKAGLRAWRPEQ